jgi:hypothetical protein
MRKFAFIAQDYVNSVTIDPGAPGSDQTFFLPEPRNLQQIVHMPARYREPWIVAFQKEVVGLLKMSTFEIDHPLPGVLITPVMDIYKCKLTELGLVDKLKCRVVFHGDLYSPTEPEDSWNPFANYMAFRIFLAVCAMKDMFPDQTDLIQAYLQCQMREKVFIQLP